MTDEPENDREYRQELELQAPRDAVWRAISNDEELRRWFAPGAEITAEVGGEVVWQWGELHRWVQRIEILEPGTRLRTRYDSAVDDEAGGKKPLFVDFLLEGDGGTTTLRLVQSGFGSESDFDDEFNAISRGWPIELGSLKHYLEHHLGNDRHLAWARGDLDLDVEEIWRRMVGPAGLNCGEDIVRRTRGDAFAFETSDGDTFEGRLLEVQPRGFSAVATSHGDAWLRVCAEECGGQCNPWIWLAAYDRPQTELDELQSRWHSMLRRLFPGISANAGILS
ncbi:MAG: SRPBCC domain-containing protein [Planctomycetota bacterium]